MKYRFHPKETPEVVVDTEQNTATFANGHTVDMVGGEFVFIPGDIRFKFRDPAEFGETRATLLEYAHWHNIMTGEPL